MNRIGKLGAVIRNARTNAALSWIFLFGIGLIAVENVSSGAPLWAGFAAVIIVISLFPPLAFRRAMVMLPWELIALAALPIVGRTLAANPLVELLTTHLSVAALALVIAVELHVFTAVRMTDRFAVLFVVVTTLAAVGSWSIVQWLSDIFLGTTFIPDLPTLMTHFSVATIAGVIAGVLFTLYFRRIDGLDARCCPGYHPRHRAVERVPSTRPIHDRIGISERRGRQVTRALQLTIVGILFVGLARRNPGIVINSAIALGVTLLPAVLERDYHISMDPGLTLWITAAVFVHAVGTLGPYQTVWWWDNLAHALSSSVVAAIGYTAIRATDLHTDDIYIPPNVLFVFILLFVAAAGVFWEVMEFTVSEVATLAGTGSVLVQYGLTDTMLDLIFDVIGGLVVALWGTIYLTGLLGDLVTWLDVHR